MSEKERREREREKGGRGERERKRKGGGGERQRETQIQRKYVGKKNYRKVQKNIERLRRRWTHTNVLVGQKVRPSE